MRTKPTVRISDHIVSTKNIFKNTCRIRWFESSFEAADSAISLAKHYGSELIAIHVIPSKTVMGHSSGMFGVVTPAFLKMVTKECEKWFAVIKKNTNQLDISLKTQIISTGESPIKEIVELAHHEEVDLIVVGTRGNVWN